MPAVTDSERQGLVEAPAGTSRELEPPPPREPWEEPPAAAWASHLGGLGRETLAVIASFSAAIGSVYLFGVASQLSGQQTPGQYTRIFLWCLIGILVGATLVFIWRRLEGLTLLGAMFTDYGRVARFGGRPPVWLDEAPGGGLRLAHLSDLHITEGDRVRMVERATPGGNLRVAELLGRTELAEAEVIVITGDITDRGTAASWRCAIDLLDRTGLKGRVVLVPGNHDLSVIQPWDGLRDPERLWRRNDRFGIVQLANLIKFCDAFAATAGGRLGTVWKGDAPIAYADVWAAIERDVRPLVQSLPGAPVPRQWLGRGFLARRDEVLAYHARIATARKALLALFPVAVPIGQDAVVFVMNSCTPVSRHPVTNALGWVGRAQYRRLDRLARAFPRPLKLVALHHHVVRRVEEQSRDLKARIFAKLTVLGDAGPLVRFCRRHHVRAVMNGHRHLSYQVRLPNGTVLLAAPSSALGDELARDPRPQFERYDLAPTIDEPTVGIYRRVIRTPLSRPAPKAP